MNDEIYAQILGRMLKNWRISNGLNLFKVSLETNNRLESIRNVENGLGKLSTLASYCRYVAQNDKFHYHSFMDDWGERMTKLEGIASRAGKAINRWEKEAANDNKVTEDLYTKVSLYLDWMELSHDDERSNGVEQILKEKRGGVSSANEFATEELIFKRYEATQHLSAFSHPNQELPSNVSSALFAISMEPSLVINPEETPALEEMEKHAVEEIHWNAKHPEERKVDAVKKYLRHCHSEKRSIDQSLISIHLLKKCSELRLLSNTELFKEYREMEKMGV